MYSVLRLRATRRQDGHFWSKDLFAKRIQSCDLSDGDTLFEGEIPELGLWDELLFFKDEKLVTLPVWHLFTYYVRADPPFNRTTLLPFEHGVMLRIDFRSTLIGDVVECQSDSKAALGVHGMANASRMLRSDMGTVGPSVTSECSRASGIAGVFKVTYKCLD